TLLRRYCAMGSWRPPLGGPWLLSHPHGQRRRQAQRQRRAGGHVNLFAALIQHDRRPRAAAGPAADERALLAAEQAADNRAARGGQSDFEGIALLRPLRHPSDRPRPQDVSLVLSPRDDG